MAYRSGPGARNGVLTEHFFTGEGAMKSSLWLPWGRPGSMCVPHHLPISTQGTLPAPCALELRGIRLAVVTPMELGDVVTMTLTCENRIMCKLFALDRGSVVFPVLDWTINAREWVKFEFEYEGRRSEVRVLGSAIGVLRETGVS